jgi:hypothetical protein
MTERLFHPSFYEHNTNIQKDQNILNSVQERRQMKLQNIDTLVSPGKYKLTVDDSQLGESNTRFLFKNLYGETLLTKLFFSKENVKNIQNLIKLVVHREVEQVIDDQSVNELLIVMRSVFLEYSAHPPLIDENTMNKQQIITLKKKYTEEVQRLNELVINAIVPKLISQLQQYLDYLRDASTQPYTIDRPISDSISGQRQYRSATQVFFGGEL